MAIEFLEGFDTFSAAQLARRYPGTSVQNMITGRYGTGQAMQTQFDGQGMTAYVTPRSEYYFGFDFVYSGYWYTDSFCILYSSAGAGILGLNTQDPSTLITGWGNSAAYALPIGTWMNLQVHVVISTTAGMFQVKVDGNYIINQTGINTGSTNIGQIRLLGGNYRFQTFDNFWIMNTLGTHSNTWPQGVMTVQPLSPLSDGTYQAWTPNFGAVHYSQVDDQPEDDDTTTVYNTNPGDKDSYGISSLSGSVDQVHAVRTGIVVRKDTGNVVKIARPFVKSSSTLVEGPGISTTTSYLSDTMLLTDDPSTSAQWTSSAINAMEIGVKTQDSIPLRLLQSAQSGLNATALAFPGNVTAGNFLVVAFGINSAISNPPPISDTLGNVWKVATYYSYGSGTSGIMYAVANGSGANTISFTGFGANDSQLIVAELSGTITTLDTWSTAGAGGYNTNEPTLTLAQNGDISFSTTFASNNQPAYVTPSSGEVMIQAVTPTSSRYFLALSYDPGFHAAGSYQSTLTLGGWNGGVAYTSAAFLVT